jgi:7-cyano-7-deazaguanine synthase
MRSKRNILQKLGKPNETSNLNLDSPSRRRRSLSENPLAIVLVSGGMDSCVCAAIAREKYKLAFLHVSYGQRTQSREQKAFHDIARHYDVQQALVCHFDHLRQIGGSSLTDKSIPVAKANLQQKEIPTSYVPFRNAHFLCVATSWAEVIGAQLIFIGAVAEDSSGYPDCRPDYYKAFNQLIRMGTKPKTKIRIVTPVIHMRKKEIIRNGIRLGAPLQLTWSCYQNEVMACGRCDSCVLRLRGFQEAGFADPILYAKRNKSD